MINQRIALIGPPNSGKTTLFNFLTGLNHKVANYSGVTISCVEGHFRFSSNIKIIDLPGITYLNKNSIDAQITTEFIEQHTDINYYILVIDSTKLAKNMLLIEQLYNKGIPFIIVLNMLDELHFRSGLIDTKTLSKTYHCPIFECSAKKGLNLYKIANFIKNAKKYNFHTPIKKNISIETMMFNANNNANTVILKKNQSHKLTDRLDAFFLHKYFGSLFLIFLTYIIFESIFSWVVPIQNIMINIIEEFGNFLSYYIQNKTLNSFLNNGILTSVGSILIFIPQIVILFFYIYLMESTGYMVRASMLVDRFFEIIGLEGKAFFPLFSANACAVPAIMATRIISNQKVRFITAIVSPFVTCSARLPIYFIIITAFVPPIMYGFISLRTMVYLSIYFISILTIAVTSKIMSMLLKSHSLQNINSSIMEIPTYKLPNIKTLFFYLYGKVMSFLKRIGKIILPFSIIIWILSYFPNNGNINNSYLSIIGKAIQPLFIPLGFDWKITVAVLSSLSAREVVISTLALLYNINEKHSTLITTFTQNISIAQGFSLLVFFIFALQCISTLVTMKKEFNSWKYPLFTFLFMFGLAYMFSFFTYQLFSIIM